MKKYICFLLSAILLFTSCSEPNPTSPDTKRDINDIVKYQIIDQTEFGFESEVFTEMVIRDEQELNRIISKYSNANSLELVDNLLKVELDKDILVVISGSTYSEKATISLDSIYIDNSGQIQIDYQVHRTIGINSRVNSPALAILIKDRKTAKINFYRQFGDEGTNPKLDGFETITVDEPIFTFVKWKLVFNTADELKQWAAENKLKKTDFIDNVDFTKEMVISVGNSRFFSGDRSYKITDVQQRGSRIVVSSTFEMIKLGPFNYVKSNHFVKIKKTGLPIYFNPTEIVNNVKPWGSFYNEYYKILSLEVTEKTEKSITKVSSYPELFSVFKPTDDFGPHNVDFDFEFFDMLIIKAPTTTYKSLKYELNYLFKDALGIKGKVSIELDNNGNPNNYDNYIFLKILKTKIPISTSFEVIIK